MFDLMFPAFLQEALINLGLVTGCILMGHTSKKHKMLLPGSFTLAILGLVIAFFAGPLLPVVQKLPADLVQHIKEFSAILGATDPLSVILFMAILSFLLIEVAVVLGHFSGGESALNDGGAVVLAAIAIGNLASGVLGFGIALAVVVVIYFITRPLQNEFFQTAIVWSFSFAAQLINLTLHNADIHFEISTYSISILGGIASGMTSHIEENSYLNWVEKAVFASVLIVSLNNTFAIAAMDPSSAALGGEFMVQLRATRLAYVLGGPWGLFVAFAGTPAVAIAGVTATKWYEMGEVSKAAFVAGGSIASIQWPLVASAILILLLNGWLKKIHIK